MGESHHVFRSSRSLVRGLRRWVTAAAGAVALTGALLTVSPPASAAGLTQVTGFGTNPGNLSMFTYAPAALPAGAPLVVALHGCTQSANDYYAHSGWPKFADAYGFALVFPQTTGANNANSCFNWFEPGDSGRGQGEALSIKQMVDKAVSLYGGDTRRVYVTGLSAGGAMTANLLAAYPDVFAGGAIASGLPAGCASTVSAAYTCMYSPPDKSPAQWGTWYARPLRSARPPGRVWRSGRAPPTPRCGPKTRRSCASSGRTHGASARRPHVRRASVGAPR